MTPLRDTLADAYLDYVNNYLTVAKFAEHHGLTEEQAHLLLSLARDVANTPHPDA